MEQNEQSPAHNSLVRKGSELLTGRGPTLQVFAFAPDAILLHIFGSGGLSTTVHMTATAALALADELVSGAASLGVVPPQPAPVVASSAADDAIAAAWRLSDVIPQSLVKQSQTNTNAGFIDWRDWCLLASKLADMRAALASVSPPRSPEAGQ